MGGVVRGTEGYAQEAPVLRERYEAVSFATAHQPILPFIPTAPARILDIGAGTGRDAATFAEMGHSVVAVEPTMEMRGIAQALHPSPRITWLDDSLPDLAAVRARDERFDFVTMTAVWMHLDEGERARAMPHVASLIGARGKLAMTLRHGPVPQGGACSRSAPRRQSPSPPPKTSSRCSIFTKRPRANPTARLGSHGRACCSRAKFV